LHILTQDGARFHPASPGQAGGKRVEAGTVPYFHLYKAMVSTEDKLFAKGFFIEPHDYIFCLYMPKGDKQLYVLTSPLDSRGRSALMYKSSRWEDVILKNTPPLQHDDERYTHTLLRVYI
jgi:hypothetical protein